MNNYGNLIKQIRRENKVTIIDLAKRMGVSQEYIAKIEMGEVEPTKEQVEVIQSFVEGRL